MATWDATQLATQVLKELNIVATGQSASAEDVAKVTDVWPSIYQQLRRAGLAPWSSSAISEEFQLPVAKYVAGEVASQFGFSGARLGEHMLTGQQGWGQIQECAEVGMLRQRAKFKDY